MHIDLIGPYQVFEIIFVDVSISLDVFQQGL